MTTILDRLIPIGKHRDTQGDEKKDASTDQGSNITLGDSLVKSILYKVDHRGLKSFFVHRKRVENFYLRLSARYSDEADEGGEGGEGGEGSEGGEPRAPKSPVVVQKGTGAHETPDGNEKIEMLAKRMTSIRGSMALMKRGTIQDVLTKRRSSVYIPDETQMESPRPVNDATASQMARHRWQVASGLVLGMARMAAFNIEDRKQAFTIGDLTFEPNLFKASKNVILASDSKFILNKIPEKRTHEQIEEVAQNLRLMGIRSFNEYPTSVQLKLVRIARYETVSPLRVIIRQGRPAENFFFLVHGTVVAIERISSGQKNEEDDDEDLVILREGEMFGETEMVNRQNHRATVISKGNVDLLTIDREDLLELFETRRRLDKPPDHILFLGQCRFMDLWPIDQLIDDRDLCTPYFFKQNALIVEDSVKNDYLVVIRSGHCRVIRKLYIRRWMLNQKYEESVQTKMKNDTDRLLRRNFRSFSRSGSKFNYVFGADHFETTLRANAIARQIISEKPTDVPPLSEKEKLLRPRVSHRLQRQRSKRQNNIDTVDEQNEQRSGLFDFEYGPKSRLEKALLMPATQEHLNIGNEKDKDNSMVPVYVQLDILKAKEVFGLDTLVFDRLYDKPGNKGLCLLSGEDEKGVDVVLLSKACFIEHATEKVRWRIRRMMKSYPSTETLKNEIERQELWAHYKQGVVKNIIDKRAFFKKILPWK